jgi:Putative Ig domain/Domain of unknown function (DUF4214)
LDPTGHFFSHDKVEGVAVVNGGTQIVLSNDSDFDVGGVNGLGAGNTAPYQLVAKPTTAGILDDGEFLVVNLTNLPAATSTATVTFTVSAVPPSNLTYSSKSATFTQGTLITADVPTNSGGPVVSYKISPSLPAGLVFNTATGIISGTPTAVSPATTYTVTATNSGGSTTATLTLAVSPPITLPPSPLPAASQGFTYNPSGHANIIAATGGTGKATLTVSNIANTTGLSIAGSGTGTVTITGIPTSAGIVSFTVKATDALGATAQQAYTLLVNPASINGNFVETTYVQFLHRPGDLGSPLDAGSWLSALNAGTSSPTAVANAISRSPEAFGVLVDGLYVKLLNRPSDSGGRTAFVSILQNGGTLEQVIATLVTSQEYQNATSTDPSFVQSLYSRLLGRTVSSSGSEVSGWVAAIATIGRSGVVNGFLQSSEFRMDVVQQFYGFTSAPVSSVASLLPNLLNRTSTPATQELSSWVNNGMDALSIELAIMASAEFNAKN